MKRRVTSILLALAMVISLSATAFAATTQTYTDVPTTHWAHGSIEACTTKGLMQGVGDSKFDPEGILTRAQVAQICYNAYKDALPSMITDKMIADVAGDAWYRDAMYWILANGIMDGSIDKDDNTFVYPDSTADRKYVALVLYRIAGKLKVELPKTNAAVSFPDIGELNSEYQTAISALQQAGVISGFPDGTYGPEQSMTRAQAAKLIDVYTDIEGLGATKTESLPPPATDTNNFLSKEIYDEIKPYAEALGYMCGSHRDPTNNAWNITFSKSQTLIAIALFPGYGYWDCIAYESYGTGSPEKDIHLYNLDDMKALLTRYAN